MQGASCEAVTKPNIDSHLVITLYSCQNCTSVPCPVSSNRASADHSKSFQVLLEEFSQRLNDSTARCTVLSSMVTDNNSIRANHCTVMSSHLLRHSGMQLHSAVYIHTVLLYTGHSSPNMPSTYNWSQYNKTTINNNEIIYKVKKINFLRCAMIQLVDQMSFRYFPNVS